MSELKMEYQENVLRIRGNVGKVIVGKETVTQLVLTALIAGGHVLLEDVPGTGKTMMAKSFAKSLSVPFTRIQFTPDLLPSDVTGINYFNQKEGAFVFRHGPVFGSIVLADEINRATPRTQSALLECMEERQVTVDGVTYALPEPFMVVATQNPVETAGTYQLPEAQLDRFLMKVHMGYPAYAEELEMIGRFLTAQPLSELAPVCTAEAVVKMQEEAKKVFVHEAVRDYIVRIVAQTRSQEQISIGVSPRGTLTMMNAARAYAYVQGRTYVTPEDVQALCIPVFAHRLILKHGMTRADNTEKLLSDILNTIEVPTEDWNR